jgi:hypothetical protein
MIAKSKSPSPSSRRVEWSVTSDHKRLRKRYELQCRTKAMSEMWRANSRRGTAGTLFLVPPPADLCSHRGRELLEPVDKPPGPSHFGEAVQAKRRVVDALPRLGRAGARPTGKRGGRASRGKASSVGSCVRERRCHWRGSRSGCSPWAPEGTWRGCCNTKTKTGSPPPMAKAGSEYGTLINFMTC